MTIEFTNAARPSNEQASLVARADSLQNAVAPLTTSSIPQPSARARLARRYAKQHLGCRMNLQIQCTVTVCERPPPQRLRLLGGDSETNRALAWLRGRAKASVTTLLWRDQLALEPVHCRFGLHGVTEFHRRLKLMRATMTFKGPKVKT
jgi:hypothetical protein